MRFLLGGIDQKNVLNISKLHLFFKYEIYYFSLIQQETQIVLFFVLSAWYQLVQM